MGKTKYRIRKIIPLESWRLMDFSDIDFLAAKTGNKQQAQEILKKYPHIGKQALAEIEHIKKMSDTRLYEQAGNSIVKNVLIAILGQLIPGKEEIYKERGENNA